VFTSPENTRRVSKRNVGLTSVDNPSPARRTAAPWALRRRAARGDDWLRASLPSPSVRQAAARPNTHRVKTPKSPNRGTQCGVAVGAETFSSLYPHHHHHLLLLRRHLHRRCSPRKRSQFILLIIHYYEPPGDARSFSATFRFTSPRHYTPITVRHINTGSARWRSEP